MNSIKVGDVISDIGRYNERMKEYKGNGRYTTNSAYREQVDGMAPSYYRLLSPTITKYRLLRLTNASGEPYLNSDGKEQISNMEYLPSAFKIVRSVGGKRRTHKRSKKARKSRKARRHH